MGNLVPYGKHKDKEWSSVPKSYLEFVGNLKESDSDLPDLCRRELEIRNKRVPDMKVIQSAYDSASFCMIEHWQEAIQSGETRKGFNSYINGFAKHAFENGEHGENGEVYFHDMKLVFEIGQIYPTLKSVSKN